MDKMIKELEETIKDMKSLLEERDNLNKKWKSQEYTEICVRLGQLYEEIDQIQDAVLCYDRALARDIAMDHPASLIQRDIEKITLLYHENPEFVKSLDQLSIIVKSHPFFFSILNGLAL